MLRASRLLLRAARTLSIDPLGAFSVSVFAGGESSSERLPLGAAPSSSSPSSSSERPHLGAAPSSPSAVASTSAPSTSTNATATTAAESEAGPSAVGVQPKASPRWRSLLDSVPRPDSVGPRPPPLPPEADVVERFKAGFSLWRVSKQCVHHANTRGSFPKENDPR